MSGVDPESIFLTPESGAPMHKCVKTFIISYILWFRCAPWMNLPLLCSEFSKTFCHNNFKHSPLWSKKSTNFLIIGSFAPNYYIMGSKYPTSRVHPGQIGVEVRIVNYLDKYLPTTLAVYFMTYFKS